MVQAVLDLRIGRETDTERKKSPLFFVALSSMEQAKPVCVYFMNQLPSAHMKYKLCERKKNGDFICDVM